MSQFYIAGKYTAKDRLIAERNIMRAAGYTVSSSWLDEPERTYYGPEEDIERQREMAWRDVKEVNGATYIVLDTIDESATGGRECEWGGALFGGIVRLILIGPARNIFHHLADLRFDNWADFHEYASEADLTHAVA